MFNVGDKVRKFFDERQARRARSEELYIAQAYGESGDDIPQIEAVQVSVSEKKPTEFEALLDLAIEMAAELKIHCSDPNHELQHKFLLEMKSKIRQNA